MGHFSDVLAAASANANTNVSMMGETFQHCATIAGALGFSVEDVSEAIGLMANSGIKSSMAGTALRTLLTKLSDEVEIIGEHLGTLTIQTANADGSMRPLKNILEEMREAFSQLTQSEKSAAAESIAGKYAMTGLLSLMNAGAEDVEKLRTAIENCDGASEQMAETMQDNAAGAAVILESAVEGLGLAIYDKFGDTLKSKVSDITDMFSELTDRVRNGSLDEEFENMAASLGNAAEQLIEFGGDVLPGVISGVAGLITILVEYRGVIAGIVSAMVTFKASMAIGKTIAGLVSSIKAVTTAIRTAETATQALTAAQTASNVAAAANPYIAVASAVLALVGGLTTLASVTRTSAETIDDLRDKTEQFNQTAENSSKAADAVHEIVEEYQELKNSSDSTEESKQRLKEIQDILIDSYGVEADKIDLVNGKYEEQLDILNGIAYKKDDEAKRAAAQAYNEMQTAEEQELQRTDYAYSHQTASAGIFSTKKYTETAEALQDSRVKKIMQELSEEYEGLEYKKVNTAGIYTDYSVKISGDSDQKAQIYDAILTEFEKAGLATGGGAVSDYYNDLVDKQSTYQAAADRRKSIAEKYHRLFGSYEPDVTSQEDVQPVQEEEPFTPNAWAMGEYSEKYQINEKRRKAKTGVDWSSYDNVKKYFQYMLDVDKITESQYYDYLERYSDELLTENTETWRSAKAEIYKGRKKLSGSLTDNGTETADEEYSDQKKYLEWQLNMGYISEADYYERLAALRDKYLDETSEKWRAATLELHRYQENQNQSKLDAIKEQYNAAINAINDEIKQHERDREDEDIDKQIDSVQRQLEYDRLDDYSRLQLERKKQELLEEKEEIQWQREHEDLKEELDTVYTMAQEAYEKGTADLGNALRTASAVFSAIGTGAAQTAAAVSTVNNNSVNMVMNAVSQTSDQIAAAVIKALSSSL